MTTNVSHHSSTTRAFTFKVGEIRGIPIQLHATALVILALVSFAAFSVLGRWYPAWPIGPLLIHAVATGCLLLASLLAHECAHSFTAQARGLGVRSITLFLFGGVAEFEAEPKTPRDELVIAAAGPAMSLALAVAFWLVGWIVAAPVPIENESVDFSELPGLASVCLWLGSLNFVLALFNLLPGFPMDGGRVFRAALWWRTGDYAHATKQAAKVGRLIAWLIIVLGFTQWLNNQIGNGIWLMLIGWFVYQLARASEQELLMRHALTDTSVADVMRTRFDRISEDTPIGQLINETALRSKQRLWPVTAGGADVGFVTLRQLQALSGKTSDSVTSRPVGGYAQPLDAEACLNPNDPATTLLEGHHAAQVVPVIEEDRVVGLIDRRDLLRWLSFRKDVEL